MPQEFVKVTQTGTLSSGQMKAAMMGYFLPYGYRFVHRSEESRARLEMDEVKAAVVREIYRWLVEEHLSTRRIAKRLTELGIPTARGAAQ